MERDRLGRRRRPEQERGLRPLHPLLPEEWASKALRVAMSESDWAELEALVTRCAGLRRRKRVLMEWSYRACSMGLSLPSLHLDGRAEEVSRSLGNEDLTLPTRIDHNARREPVSGGPL